ncbi:MAG: hypothetical protein PHW69_08965 [Elusimicrobiaceae bacterium]|nr:hypothetical protein [Elusimicrobiaceae bacterium]
MAKRNKKPGAHEKNAKPETIRAGDEGGRQSAPGRDTEPVAEPAVPSADTWTAKDTQTEIPAGEPQDMISRLVQTDTFRGQQSPESGNADTAKDTGTDPAPESGAESAAAGQSSAPKAGAPAGQGVSDGAGAQENKIIARAKTVSAKVIPPPPAEKPDVREQDAALPPVLERAEPDVSNIDDIFSTIEVAAAPPQEAPAPRRRKTPPEELDEKKSLRRLREKLSELGWSRDEVYRLSVKFFGRRTAAEIDEDYRNLLNSFRYVEKPEENRELALKVMLDELTSTEAVKSSHIRMRRGELREQLAELPWAADMVDALVEKYADEKTAEELLMRFNIILSDLPYDASSSENNALAAGILLDASRFDESFEIAGKRVYALALAREFEDIPQELSQRLTDKYWNSVNAEELGEMSDRISSEIRHGEHPRNFILSLRVLTGELTKEEAFNEARRRKNVDDIAKLGEKIRLEAELVASVTSAYTGADGNWFDAEFPKVFARLYVYSGSAAANAVLSVRALAGEITADEAVLRSLAGKNAYDIGALAEQIFLEDEFAGAVLEFYARNRNREFVSDYSGLLARFPQHDGVRRFAPRNILHTIVGDMGVEKAVFVSEIMDAFDSYNVAPEDAGRLADKYMGLKTADQLKAEYESVLSKIPCLESQEENQGVALDVLLDGSGESLRDAVEQAAIVRDRTLFQRELNKYGWFVGYAAEITERFLGRKQVDEVVSSFTGMLDTLPFAVSREDNADIARKVLMGRMSEDEARRQAEFRRDLAGKRWAVNYINEIVSAYLGTKKPAKAVEALDRRLSKYGFLNLSRALNRYAVDLAVLELNGQARELPVTLALELMEAEISLENVKRVYAEVEAKKELDFNPVEVAQYYRESMASGITADEAVSRVIGLFSKDSASAN